MRRKLLRTVSVNLDIKVQLLIIYSAFIKYMRENGNTLRQCVSYLYI